MKSFLSSVLLFCLLFSQQVFSQYTKDTNRKGLVFGLSTGLGYSILKFPEKNQNDIGIGLDIKFGYMIQSNLAILLTSNVTVYDYSGYGRDRKRDFGILAPSVQYWVGDKFWVLGGIGIGGDSPVFWDIKNPDSDALETKYYSGLGVITSVGYEIYQKKNFAIDLKTKIIYRNVKIQEDKSNGVSFALLLGLNLY
jgi:hypothetical protein